MFQPFIRATMCSPRARTLRCAVDEGAVHDQDRVLAGPLAGLERKQGTEMVDDAIGGRFGRPGLPVPQGCDVPADVGRDRCRTSHNG
ncbi:hypothetical protein GCM10010260_59590 [Streptomyces filipinensis]|uniref:Uncharacterized protein n=1 Tax=Streptomyces filipinensis TaxID=66887 RepID=A0A918IFR2_9ACTN|nr:hypothetical protein GCM10010260_59590 [Streptomyces filipinensis]